MYLEAEYYVKNWDHNGPERHTDVTVLTGGKPNPHIDTTKISKIICEVGYWRKANQIHAWFVERVQGGRDECQRAYVDPSQLQELLALVTEALDNKGKAAELLPTRSGFFFGGTEYDEWYWQDLEATKEILEALNLDGPAKCDYYYQSSW